jgi:hypothetical protein
MLCPLPVISCFRQFLFLTSFSMNVTVSCHLFMSSSNYYCDLFCIISVLIFIQSLYAVHHDYFVVKCRSLLGSIHALVQDPIRSWLSDQQLRDCCSCWVTLVQQPSPLNHLSRLVIPTRIWTKVGRYDLFIHCTRIEFLVMHLQYNLGMMLIVRIQKNTSFSRYL